MKERGIGVVYTTRRYYESDKVLKLFGINAIRMGRFGETLYEKVLFSSQRLRLYVKFLNHVKPDFVASVGSPEAARAAFGLGIPHLMISDTPHAEAVARLSVPLSTKLFTPWIIPKTAWSRYGMREEDIIQYRAIDQVAWMEDYIKKRKSSRGSTSPILVYRPEEFKAAHAFVQKPVSLEIVSRLLASIEERHDIRPQVIVLARYGYSSAIKEKLGDVRIPRGAIDGAQLLTTASLFISGGGGTMTGEAALLGVPTLSVSAFENYVENFLIRKGLVFKSASFYEIVDFAHLALTFDQTLLTRLMKGASRVLSEMIDPTRKIATSISKSFP